MGKIVVITGAKGGCGKTTLTAALGRAMAELGKTTCLVDACVGRRGLDLLLGVQDKVIYDLFDLASGECAMEQALLTAGERLFFVSCPAENTAGVSPKQVCGAVQRLGKRFDCVLLDTSGIFDDLPLTLCAEADEVLLVTLPGDEASRGCERAAVLLREKTRTPVSLVMNAWPERVPGVKLPAPEAEAAYLDLPLLGSIARSEAVYAASFNHPVSAYPEKIRREILCIARRLCGENVPPETVKARRFPWRS